MITIDDLGIILYMSMTEKIGNSENEMNRLKHKKRTFCDGGDFESPSQRLIFVYGYGVEEKRSGCGKGENEESKRGQK